MAFSFYNQTRAKLVRSSGYQGHHIIPTELANTTKDFNCYKDSEIYNNARTLLIESGYDVKNQRNCIYLPDGKRVGHATRPVHRGSHPQYTQDVAERLSDLYIASVRNNWTQEEKLQAVQALRAEIKSDLKSGDIKLNNAIDHTQDPNSSKPGSSTDSISPPPSPRGGGGGSNEGPDTGGDGKGGNSNQSPAEKTKAAIRQIAAQKAEQKFADDVNQNGLTETWNKGGYGKPIQSNGSFGDIGGVAITGGITDPDHGLAVGMDHTHALMIPKTALFGSQPMNDAEMQQLIRELHDAIIVEGTLPFFSLHFNAQHGYTDALYPIIPPQYENTIAGKTLLDLDYAMKGFLNGGLGPNNGFSDTAIDFKELTKATFEKLGEPDPGYMSLNELYNETGLQALRECNIFCVN